MLKELFESTFYATFPARKGVVVSLTERVYTGDFALVDPKACRDCLHHCGEATTDRKQLMVRTRREVNAISIDDVMSNVNEAVGPTCDYMLDDGKKVALIEMTCSTSKYATSKRQRARAQLCNTLCLLYANPDIQAHLERESERMVIFSWRDTQPESDVHDPVEFGMKGLTSMVDDVYTPDNVTLFDHDFLLVEIRYPTPLVW